MKLKTTLLAATLAAFAVSSAFANDAEVKAETPKMEKAEAKKPAKRHSHMEEKTGMPMSESKASGENAPKKPAKRHNHVTDR